MLNHDLEELCNHAKCQSVFTFKVVETCTCLLKRANEVILEVLILQQYPDIVEALQQTALNFNRSTQLQASLLLLLLLKCVLSLVFSRRGSTHEKSWIRGRFATEKIIHKAKACTARATVTIRIAEDWLQTGVAIEPTRWSVIWVLIHVRHQLYFLLFNLLLERMG